MKRVALLLLLLFVGSCRDFVEPEFVRTFEAREFEGTVRELEPPRLVSADGGIVVEGGFATDCPAEASEIRGLLEGSGTDLTLRVMWFVSSGSRECLAALNLFTYRAEIQDLAPGIYHLQVRYRGESDALDHPDPPFDGHVEVR